MKRVLITGGSRGIGAAISTALKDAGYTVAATYAGNDEKAAAFTAETGIKTFTCTCNHIYTEEIPALGHTEETVAGKEATCTETGLTEGKKCTVCGVTTVEQTEIKALGHTEETIAGKAATCTETGLTEGKKCTVCGFTAQSLRQRRFASRNSADQHQFFHRFLSKRD